MNHTDGNIQRFLSKRITLFLIFSALLHGLFLTTWEESFQFDFGGQQLNQRTIQVALSAPAPKQPTPDPIEEPIEEPIEPTPEPVEKVIQETPKPVEKAVKPAPQPEPKITQEKLPPAPSPTPPLPQPETEPTLSKLKRPAAPTKEKTEKPVAIEAKKEPTPQKKAKTPTTESQPKPKPAPESNKKEASENEATQQSRAMIRRQIQSELVRHFEYPRLARRRGWEGKIHLEFTVQPNGKISNIRILEGSRHGILNRSAVETMTRIGKLNQISEGILLGPIRMEIPIIYQLNDH